jgi:hypothetical protein
MHKSWYSLRHFIWVRDPICQVQSGLGSELTKVLTKSICTLEEVARCNCENKISSYNICTPRQKVLGWSTVRSDEWKAAHTDKMTRSGPRYLFTLFISQSSPICTQSFRRPDTNFTHHRPTQLRRRPLLGFVVSVWRSRENSCQLKVSNRIICGETALGISHIRFWWTSHPAHGIFSRHILKFCVYYSECSRMYPNSRATLTI